MRVTTLTVFVTGFVAACLGETGSRNFQRVEAITISRTRAW